MTYAIVNIMYGVPLSNNDWDEERPELIEEVLENVDTDETKVGFQTFYSGGASVEPAAFGVVLGEFDEATHHTEMSEVFKQPTPDQVREYSEALAALDEPLRLEVQKFGEPRVFLLWSTS